MFKKKAFLGSLTKGDVIGAGASLLGNIGSGVAGLIGAKKMKAPSKPVDYSPVKLQTSVNVNPQLDNIERSRTRMTDHISSNSASSAGKLARLQGIEANATDAKNRIYGEKSNIETGLINEDARNQQDVRMRNVDKYNTYQDKLSDFNARRTAFKTNIAQSMITGVTDTVDNLSTMNEQRKAEANKEALIISSNPEVSPAQVHQNGYEFSRKQAERFAETHDEPGTRDYFQKYIESINKKNKRAKKLSN